MGPHQLPQHGRYADTTVSTTGSTHMMPDHADGSRWSSVLYAKGYLTALLMLNAPAHGGRLSSSGDLPAVVAFGAGQRPLVLRDALRKGGTASERPSDTDGAHLLEMEVAILLYLREFGNQARVEATSAAVGWQMPRWGRGTAPCTASAPSWRASAGRPLR